MDCYWVDKGQALRKVFNLVGIVTIIKHEMNAFKI